jgi:acetylornithine/succinyldiaminopimelate/putrescine aminotransferase/predicted amino acid dehydrogenase
MSKNTETQTDSSLSSNANNASYETFAQPLTGQLLRALELSVIYHQGHGQWLTTEIAGETRRVLDMTGGYGANLLGHKNARIARIAQDFLSEGEPNLIQGSNRAKAGELAQRISEILYTETGEGPWVTTLSNSGTEAVEAALKHCLLAYGKKQQERLQDLQKGMNEAHLYVQELDENQLAALTQDWRYRLINMCSDIKASDKRKDWLLHMALQTHDMMGLIDLVHEFNKHQLSEIPLTVSLERAYHGKTMGALNLTHNPKYRYPFYVSEGQNRFLPPHADDVQLEKFFGELKFDIIEIGLHQIGLFFGKTTFTRVAGLFVEPIQGEAGVYPLDANYLALLKKYSLKDGFSLVFDEIQAGMFRTGLMASGHHAHVTADIYCFSKTLGAGVAKIGATTIHHKRYQEDFGHLHASTFAEDGYSAAIALEALEIITQSGHLTRGMNAGDKIKKGLETLQDKYPHLISGVRGKGLMLAFELSENLSKICFEFNVFNEAGMLGYLIASAMLHRENIRMTPSLSNGATLRVQPSLFITDEEILFFLIGLEKILMRLDDGDFRYFFQHLYPDTPLADIKAQGLTTEFVSSDKPLAVFLCHLIDADHVKRVTPAFIPVKDAVLESRLGLMKRAMEFGIYHAQPLKGADGSEINIILMGIPTTSLELKKSFTGKQRSEIIAKVQRAVDMAAELGANTVGLGQFTSIVSGNGLYLDSHGMNLTTGNSFTIELAIQAALREARNKDINIATSSVGLVGAAGNIISVAAMIMADKASRLVLIHHSPIEKSPKLLGVVRTILKESLDSLESSDFNQRLSERLTGDVLNSDKALIDWLNTEEQRDLIQITDNVAALRSCEIIITGASSGTGFLEPQHFTKNAVVVDVAVPANIKPDVLARLKIERPDVTYCLGGVAKLPHLQSIVTPLFPLDTNESFACMAETFAMGFLGKQNLKHIGNLTKTMVNNTAQFTLDAGFTLGSTKTKSSL